MRVVYRRDGAVHRVRAKNCILACYNALIPHLLPELPQAQKDALKYGIKVPMMYNNVLIRRWTAFEMLSRCCWMSCSRPIARRCNASVWPTAVS